MASAPPRGVWAVASELASRELEAWMNGVAGAAAWTFRRPPAGDAQALIDLAAMRARAPWLAVHGRRDLAQLSGADAVIAGTQSLAWPELGERCRQLSPELRCGASVHSVEEWHDAERALDLSFVVLGPFLDTPSKRGILEPQGEAGCRALVALGRPVIAIGGIEEAEQVQQAHRAGAHGVAVLRAAQDPVRFAELCAAWAELD